MANVHRIASSSRIEIESADDTSVGDRQAGAYLNIETDADTYWVGEGTGLPYGSCYGNEIGWSQANAVQNTWYNVSDADMSDGNAGLNLVTHDGSGKLTVTNAGRYQVNFTATIEVSIANTHVQSGIEINGSGTAIGDGQTHWEGTANTEVPHSGCAQVDLAAGGTIEVSVCTTDANTPTISVSHLTITVFAIGGT